MSARSRSLVRLSAVFLVTFVVAFLVAVPLLEAKRSGQELTDPSREMEGVVDVNSENYYDVVGHERYVLLEFYAPWCGHCHDFSSLYADFGKYVQVRPDLVDRLVVAKVNSPDNKRIERRYKIQGYPTLLLVPPHQHVGKEYQHSRDFNELVDFVEKEMGKPA